MDVPKCIDSLLTFPLENNRSTKIDQMHAHKIQFGAFNEIPIFTKPYF